MEGFNSSAGEGDITGLYYGRVINGPFCAVTFSCNCGIQEHYLLSCGSK
ncbi:MAG: hypothetical protein GYA68_01360 [Syntrophorhabdus sp.]|jgi:hypothetical protein|nr:hypothetical protein [Syntrophorhabdus sp.]